MEALLPLLKGHPGPSVLVFALLFRLVSWVQRRTPVPQLVKQDEFRHWRWRNLSLSLVHSLLTGTWALTCAAASPQLLIRLDSYHTPLSYLLVCVSSGYFVQDAADIILSGHARGSWEFLLHHAMVICCFVYTLYTERYVAGAVVALFVEVNSVTLHLRLLLKLAAAQSSLFYRLVKFINIFTYVAFRLPSQFYLTWYIVHNYSRLTHGGFFLACMTIMNVMILVYFYRLLRSDFFPPRKSKVEETGQPNGVKRFLRD
ncbi:TLC domain-containing protein 1 [Salarias fasciatus]|uniref:TLC domain-containing protein n=1 Tax=Salarias fasciatus TaxID=181472 RepID=A0A672GR14_SALFA|nr:calfacilitin [Salarias fasciatus]